MKLRPAVTGDIAALTALLASAFAEYVRGIGRDAPGPYDWLDDRVAAGDVTLADDEAGAAPIGAVILSKDGASGALTVDMLAVTPAAQGCGVGRKLLDHAEGQARAAGCGKLHLHTVAKYTHLVRYYERHGFTVSHHGPRPKGDDGHPRVFMTKTLRTPEVQE